VNVKKLENDAPAEILPYGELFVHFGYRRRTGNGLPKGPPLIPPQAQPSPFFPTTKGVGKGRGLV